jgi:hypothetical protein
MSAFYDQASLVVVPSGYKSGKIYAQKPLTTDGQLTFTRASTATRVNASGLIETVASGVPRLDYTNSSCPKLLLEPQRTNNMFYSEQINAAPNVVESSTYTANAYTSPDGTQNAAQFTETTANDRHGFYQYATISSQAYTASVFTKQTGRRYIAFTTDATGSQRSSFFDLQTKSVLTSGTGHTCSVQDYGNGWLRLIVSLNASSGSRYFIWGGSIDGIGIGYVGSTSLSQTFWGNQLEAGAYATSYIPTTSAAVTRVVETIPSKTTLLSNKTAYSIFLDFYPRPTSTFTYFFQQLNSSENTEIIWGGSSGGNDFAIYDYTVSGSVAVVDINDGNRHKIVLTQIGNKIDLFVDGQKVRNQFTTAATGFYYFNITGNPGIYKINTLMTMAALTDSNAIELTTL